MALEKRHLIDEGEPEMEEWRRCMDIATNLMGHLGLMRVATAEEVVAHKGSPAARRRYEEAFYLDDNYGQMPNLQKVSMFIKLEKWTRAMMFDPDGGVGLGGEYATKYKPPRAIQYRSFRYCAQLSRYLLPIEEELWQFLEPWTGLCPFAKKMSSFAVAENIVQMGKLFSDPVYILADHSKFDSCVSTPWIALEHNAYMLANPCDELDALMEMQYMNEAYTKGGIKYVCKARKMSGEYNTSLGDTKVNYAVLSDVFRGVEHAKLLNGDDSVIVIERDSLRNLDLSPEMWKRYGFKTTWSVVSTVEEVDFCQARPVEVREGVWRMVRLPARAISRGIVSVKRYLGPAWYALAAAIGQSELACGDGVPMMQAFAQLMIRSSLGAKPLASEISRRAKLEGVANPEAREVTELARHSFAMAFDITPQEQCNFETWCDAQVMEILPATRPDDRSIGLD